MSEMRFMMWVAAGLVAVPTLSEAQSAGRTCRTTDSGYVYTFRTPSGDSQQHDVDLYFNQGAAAFVLLVFDSDTDTVLSTSSGLSTNDRFVHGSLRLFPSETYRVAVGCVRRNATYRLAVRRGREIALGAPRVLNAHEGLTAAEATESIALESVMNAAIGRMERAFAGVEGGAPSR